VVEKGKPSSPAGDADRKTKGKHKNVKTMVLPFEYEKNDPRMLHVYETQQTMFPEFLAEIRNAHHSWQYSLLAKKFLYPQSTHLM